METGTIACITLKRQTALLTKIAKSDKSRLKSPTRASYDRHHTEVRHRSGTSQEKRRSASHEKTESMNEVNNLALGKAESNVNAQLFEESWWVEDSHFTFHSANIVNHWRGGIHNACTSCPGFTIVNPGGGGGRSGIHN